VKSAFNIQLDGFAAANRDAQIHLTHETTGETVTVKPFLDGKAVVRDLTPGPWQLEVTHPNLSFPIERRKIRLFDQPTPTFVPVPVPQDLFRDTPIRDIPDADLGPVQQTVTAARTTLAPVGNKIAGEAIRAADWNVLVGAVVDLSTAMLELTRLVSPKGHSHPELEEKFSEVQDNIRRFAEAFGRSLVELRREIETATLHQTVKEVVEAAELPATERMRIVDRVAALQDAPALQADTPTFTRKLATTGTALLNELQDIAAKQPDADQFLARPDVKQLQQVARQYTEAGTQTRPESELMTYTRTTAATGAKLRPLIGRF
jgi:hypothetical protein